MSVDNDVSFDQNPIAHAQPPKSGGKKWLLGGCGCLAFLGLICLVGGGFAVYQLGLKPLNDFTKQNLTLAKESAQLKETVGEPVEMGTPLQTKGDETGTMNIRTPVSGSKGNGTIVIKTRMESTENGMPRWTRQSMVLEFDGQEIELNPDAELVPDLDIDLGF